MNFRKNRGYVATDASIAVIVLLIIIPTITGIVFNINQTNNKIDRKTQALNIAVNTIEASKSLSFQNLSKENIIKQLNDAKIYANTIDNEGTLAVTNNSYKINITVVSKETTKKSVTAKVEYKSGNKTENIELTTSISQN